MSKYVAKAAVRQAKNLAKGFTEIQVKVREATSNDPWGPSGTQMAELADASFRPYDRHFLLIS
jgi:epsin